MSILAAAAPLASVTMAPLQVNSDAIVNVHEAASGGLLPSSSVGLVIMIVASLFWVVTYIIVIAHGFREKRPMIPAVAVLLNASWEVLAAFQWPSYLTGARYVAIIWLAVDSIIIYQLFRFGRAPLLPHLQHLQRYWGWALSAGFLLALGGHHYFTAYNGDHFGLEDAFMINLVMSLLFIRMYTVRREAGKAMRWIAWTKMLGTALTSVSLVLIFRTLQPAPSRDLGFIYYLMFACFFFDMIYIVLLSKAEPGGSTEEPRLATAAA